MIFITVSASAIITTAPVPAGGSWHFPLVYPTSGETNITPDVLINLTNTQKLTKLMVLLLSDYKSLRIGGLIFAVVLFLMGIAFIISECVITWC